MFSILSIKPRNSNGKGKSTYGLNGNTIQTLLLVFQKATHTYMYVAYISIEQVVLENLNLTKQHKITKLAKSMPIDNIFSGRPILFI
jgi:hypothetical protein